MTATTLFTALWFITLVAVFPASVWWAFLAPKRKDTNR